MCTNLKYSTARQNSLQSVKENLQLSENKILMKKIDPSFTYCSTNATNHVYFMYILLS